MATKKKAATPATEQPPAETKTTAPPVEAETPPAAEKKPAANSESKGTIDRILKVTKPLIKGDDVKAVQEALIAKKLHCGADGAKGVYNATTAYAVRCFQAQNSLIVTGIVDKFTATALGFTFKG